MKTICGILQDFSVKTTDGTIIQKDYTTCCVRIPDENSQSNLKDEDIVEIKFESKLSKEQTITLRKKEFATLIRMVNNAGKQLNITQD